MVSTLAHLLLAILPADPWPVDYVDCVEVNTVMDHDGQRRFTQILWVNVGGPNEIVDWRFYCPQMLPIGGVCLFEDKGKPRAVHLTNTRVLYSETFFDPEVERRKIQPLLFRQKLQNSPE
jgi:hypothetical protein